MFFLRMFCTFFEVFQPSSQKKNCKKKLKEIHKISVQFYNFSYHKMLVSKWTLRKSVS